MTGAIVPFGIAALVLLVIEGIRWAFRPEARRLRTIRKIGGRR